MPGFSELLSKNTVARIDPENYNWERFQLFTLGGNMSNLNSALQQLRDERKQAQAQVERLNHAITVIEGLAGHSYASNRGSKRGRSSLSPAARKRISVAQRARWAARRRRVGRSAGPKSVSRSRKPLSVAGRRKIAAAQRARWARYRAQHKAAA
jgi:hypothetical protein